MRTRQVHPRSPIRGKPPRDDRDLSWVGVSGAVDGASHLAKTHLTIEGTTVDLSGYDDDDLWENVLKDQMGPEHDWSRLLQGDNAERIRSVLVQQANDVNGLIAARKSAIDAVQAQCRAEGPPGRARWFEAKADYDVWRRKALYFKRRVEMRSAEARRAYDEHRRDRHAKMTSSAGDTHRYVLRELAIAIAEHQKACACDSLRPTKADMRLWGVLENLRVPYGGGDATLSTMIETAWQDRA